MQILTMEPTVSIKLPNLFEITKSFNAKFNSHYDEVKDDAKKWILDLVKIYKNGKYLKMFERENVQKLGAYMFSQVSKDGLRVAMDLINLITFYDEISDHDVEGAEMYGKIMINVIENLNHEDGERDFGAGIKRKEFYLIKFSQLILYQFSFLLRVQRLCESKNEFDIFVSKFLEYIPGVIQESKRRQNKIILDYETYKMKRVISGGVNLMSYLGILTQNINLSQEILDDKFYQKLERNILDLQFVANVSL